MTEEELKALEKVKTELETSYDPDICYLLAVIETFQKENAKQKEILDLIKPYFIVENLRGKYWLRVGGAGYDKWLVYKITKDKFELLEEWKENE